jgi:hypothetical protein
MNIRRFALPLAALAVSTNAVTISDANFSVDVGTYGEISSLTIVGDAFPTCYVMNATNSPDQNTSDHEWMGELMFKYRKGSATAWDSAFTNLSDNGRTVTKNSGTKASVHYANATGAGSIRDFTVDETFELVNNALAWTITVTNTTSGSIEIGDFGLPLPFNEKWPDQTVIYETQTIKHSFVGHNGSYITAKRPSGIGNFVLFTPDATTGAALEYMDNWRNHDHGSSMWRADTGNWAAGLNVYYIHSNVIKSGGRGYLPNTSLTLAAGASKTYAFKFHNVASEAAVRDMLYSEGMVDVNVAPGMIIPLGDVAHVDLHTSKTIGTITFQYPSESSSQFVSTVATDHKLYDLKLSHLGENIVTANYGTGEKIALQFYVIERPGDAVQRHATFMVNNTQISNPGVFNDKIFDDWMMDTKSRRNAFTGYQGFTYWMGWGDDWGYTHGQFLAEKNVMMPVASEIKALDDYLEVGVWGSIMKTNHTDFMIHDWLSSPVFTDDYLRGYAYPHVYNTFFSMYKIAKLHPDITTYRNSALTYLNRCYGVMNALFTKNVNYAFDAGLMGELTTPEIIAALDAEGLTTQANNIRGFMTTKWNTFKSSTYPYGSEYNYDNTGEEAVYTLAKMNSSTTIQSKIQDKTRACRGWQPAWYYYGVPVTICGENWWNFQYTAALAGAAMDDWMRYHSATPDLDARGTYAAKLANFTAVNSGQIDSDPANIGTVSWTYQAMKGNFGAQGSAEAQGTANVRTELHNGWRSMSGEADLGLFGALKIISADVAQDPVFGLVGYGCDVTHAAGSYAITVDDGIGQRVNVIPLKLWVSLNQDHIQTISVSDAKDRVEAALSVGKSTAHTATLTLEGFAAGNYVVYVDGAKQGTFTASGASVKASIPLTGAATADVVIQSQTSALGGRLPTRARIVRLNDRFEIALASASDPAENPRVFILSATGERLADLGMVGNRPLVWTPGENSSRGLCFVQARWPDGRVSLIGQILDVR